MNRWIVGSLLLFSVSGYSAFCSAQSQGSDVDKARSALAQKNQDEDASRQLEEVFQSAKKNYSLQKKGSHALTYYFDYSYTGDQRLDLAISNGSIRNIDVVPSATHTMTNSFYYEYGLDDNITVSGRVPLVVKYDTQDELSLYDVGDMSFTARWQPLAYVPGKMSTTLFSTFISKTGTSPYEIDVNRQLSSGSGYYSLAGGASVSRLLDPVILFGSLSVSYNMPVSGLNQVRGARVLEKVEPGFGLSGSFGFAYSLSYDISLSISTQLTYSNQTVLTFRNGEKAVAQDQMSGFLSLSLGTRISETTIINTSLGIGLTAGAPDFNVGLSLPLNISGLKE